ncbi:MAG TPA: alpha/beta hydrolase [Gammaproteobacteria bacterium]|nr:alpha/beta hydrolase [Gammaproteobacteria bacterium]
MVSSFLYWHGHKIHVTECGSGDPLLLITGLGGHVGMWDPLLHHFDSHRIIAFDPPGAGDSSVPMMPVQISRLADLVAAVLTDRGVEWADVIGYSYGGAIAQQFAHDFPARVRRLVLAATTCGIGGTPGSPRAMTVLATPVRYYSKTYFNRTAEQAFGGRTGRNAVVRQQIMESRHKHPPSTMGYAMQIAGAAGWSSLPFLHEIPHETLIVSGDDDPLVPVANAHQLAALIPRARLEIVENAGHLFLWDDAERQGVLINEFLYAPYDEKVIDLRA